MSELTPEQLAITEVHQETSLNPLPLRECVRQSIKKYFSHLDGQCINGLYDIVLAEIEEPLLETVMQFMGSNQSKAAQCLGLSRGTLRKKLIQYGLLEL